MEKYRDKALSNEERARDLLERMTLREKVGQIAQPFKMFDEYKIENGEIILSEKFRNYIAAYGGIGTVFSFFRADPWSGRNYDNGICIELREKAYNTMQRYIAENSRLGIPALFEENAPHGLQVLDSVMYPTNIGIGAAFDSKLAYKMAVCIAEECKSFGIQVPNSSLFDMACDPRFGRSEECLSEDPYLASRLCGEIVKGYKDTGIMICCKHYCAQGAALGGHCGGVTNIGERELHEIHLPSVAKAVENGADFIMVSYNDVDGVRCHANRRILKDILQNEIGFNGVIRADRTGNDFCDNLTLAGAQALNAGVMLGLGDTAFSLLEAAVENGYTDMQTVDNAVYHILLKKFESGIMDNPYIEEKGQSAKYIESGISQDTTYRAAAESLVLLKNENGVLPLKSPVKLAVFGEHADSIYPILGDYTSPQRTDEMLTVFGALKLLSPDAEYTKGWDFFGGTDDFENALQLAETSDAAVICLGGSSARDFSGVYNAKGQAVATKDNFMDCGEGRDVCSLELPGSQLELLRRLKAIGKPVISILIQGRTYLLDEVMQLSDAVIIAWYPGQEGPRAIADTLFGKLNCFGRLPVSVPNSPAALPVYYNRRPMPDGYIDLEHLSDYPFGSGLNYSDVKYSDFTADELHTAAEISGGAEIKLSICAENQSNMPVNEVVMLFIHAKSGSILRRVKELKGFKRVELAAGERKKIEFTLSAEELKIYGTDNRFTVEPAEIEVFAGGNINDMRQLAIKI